MWEAARKDKQEVDIQVCRQSGQKLGFPLRRRWYCSCFSFLLSYTRHTIKLRLRAPVSFYICKLCCLPQIKISSPYRSLALLFSHSLPIGSHSSDTDHCSSVILCALELHINRILQYIPPPNNLLGACWVPGTVPSPGDAAVMRQTKSQPSWNLNSAQKGERSVLWEATG